MANFSLNFESRFNGFEETLKKFSVSKKDVDKDIRGDKNEAQTKKDLLKDIEHFLYNLNELSELTNKCNNIINYEEYLKISEDRKYSLEKISEDKHKIIKYFHERLEYSIVALYEKIKFYLEELMFCEYEGKESIIDIFKKGSLYIYNKWLLLKNEYEDMETLKKEETYAKYLQDGYEPEADYNYN